MAEHRTIEKKLLCGYCDGSGYVDIMQQCPVCSTQAFKSMSEPLSSNPQCEHWWEGGICADCAMREQDWHEIERLTAERARILGSVTVGQYGELLAERDRLRAALEQIRDMPASAQAFECARIAIEALAGAADTQSRISDENTASRIKRDTDETTARQAFERTKQKFPNTLRELADTESDGHGFVGDGPNYSCFLCGKTAAEHQ